MGAAASASYIPEKDSGQQQGGEDDDEDAVPLQDVRAQNVMRAVSTVLDEVLRCSSEGDSSQLAQILDDLGPGECTVRLPTLCDAEGQTALHLATLEGHPECVTVLLDKGDSQQVGVTDSQGMTALHLAARQGHAHILAMLLQQKPSAEVLAMRAGESGNTALHECVEGGHVECVRLLVQAGSQWWWRNKKGCTAVHLAAWWGHLELLSHFMKEGDGDRVVDPEDPDHQGKTLVHLAAEFDHPEVLRWLFGEHLSCQVQPTDADGETPMHLAARNNNLLIASILVDSGHDPYLRNLEGKRPVDLAMEEGNTQVEEWLRSPFSDLPNRESTGSTLAVESDLPVDEPDSSDLLEPIQSGNVELLTSLLDSLSSGESIPDSCLHLSCSLGQDGPTLLLLERGCDHSAHHGPDLSTPVHQAAIGGHASCLQLLLDNGASPDLRMERDLTPLHCAALHGHPDCLRVLLSSGADPSAMNETGDTPLHVATWQGRLECVAVLIEGGASLDASNRRGRTALHEAAWQGNVDLTTMLVQAGASLDVRGASGGTPLHDAVENGKLDAVAILVRSGASLAARNGMGRTAMHQAAEFGHLNILQVLAGESRISLEDADDLGSTPLHLSCQRGHLRVARQLLEWGCRVGPRDCRASTPLHLASMGGHQEVADLLLGARADPAARDQVGKRPCDLAQEQGWVGLARSLAKGVGGNIAKSDEGDEGSILQLHAAVKEGKVGAVRRLLEEGEDLNEQDASGNCALHLAALFGHRQMVFHLLRCGANQTLHNNCGNTAAHLAVLHNHPSILGLLSRHDQNAFLFQVNSQNEEGCTPLHYAVMGSTTPASVSEHDKKPAAAPTMRNNGAPTAMEALLQDRPSRVRINARNAQGYTALHLAAFRKAKSEAEILLKHLGDPRCIVDGDMTEELIEDGMPVLVPLMEGQKVRLEEEYTQVGMPVDALFRALYSERDDLFLYLLSKGIVVPTMGRGTGERGRLGSLSGWKGRGRGSVDGVLRARGGASFEIVQPWSKGEELNQSDGRYTLLQLASLLGMDTCVDALLRAGADPNGVSEVCPLTPLLLAASWGHHRVLASLQGCRRVRMHETTATGENILHILAKGIHNTVKEQSFFSQYDLDPERQDFDASMQQVLTGLESKGSFPFYVNDEDADGCSPLVVAATHRSSASVVHLLAQGADPWQTDPTGRQAVDKIPARTLNTYLDRCIQLSEKSHHPRVLVNFSLLRPPSEGPDESQRLELFRTSHKHRQLLKHPVFATFLQLKWYCLRGCFWANLLLYLVFEVAWSTHVVLQLKGYNKGNPGETIASVFTICSQAALAFLVIRETCQFLGAPKRYFLSLENWMELGIIGCATTDFILDSVGSKMDDIAVIGLLLSWVELVLLIGRFPALARYIEMFSAVLKNYLSFLVVFAALIIGFVLCFHLTLGRTCTKPEDPAEQPDCFFKLPELIGLKTTVMMIGELEFHDANLDTPTTRLLYLLFLFLVVLVLMNLLNALAVSDTQEIAEQAELYGLLSRIELVCYIESFFSWLERWRFGRFQWGKWLWRKFRGGVLLFPRLPRGTVSIDLSNGRVGVVGGSGKSTVELGWRLRKEVVESLRELVEAKQKEEEESKEKGGARELRREVKALQEPMLELQEDLEDGLELLDRKLEQLMCAPSFLKEGEMGQGEGHWVVQDFGPRLDRLEDQFMNLRNDLQHQLGLMLSVLQALKDSA